MKQPMMSGVVGLVFAGTVGVTACASEPVEPQEGADDVQVAVEDEGVQPKSDYCYCSGENCYEICPVPEGMYGAQSRFYNPNCCQGRPLVINDEPRVASVEERDDWA